MILTSSANRTLLIVCGCALLLLPVHAATHNVTFQNTSFSPSALTIDVGDTVVFANAGGFHTVTGTATDPFCGNDPVPASCSVTFKQPGVFPYRCLIHSTEGPSPTGMIGSITVREAGPAGKPNLVPFHLNGWSGPIVVSRAPGNHISDPDFYDDQDIWLDWAIANISLTTGVTLRFFTEILIDGVSKFSWFHDGLAPDTFNKIEDYNLGALSAATHSITLVTDHTGVVDESDETDNRAEISVRVIPSIAHKHTVLVSNFKFNPGTLTVRKGDTVDFQVLEGSHTATGPLGDPFCGDNAVSSSCTVAFTKTGTFPYRCLFHSSGGASPQGMVGQIRVIDEVQAEKASSVRGPFAPATDAKVSYPDQTVSFPAPTGPTFWRLSSTVPLRIGRIDVKSSTVVLSFE